MPSLSERRRLRLRKTTFTLSPLWLGFGSDSKLILRCSARSKKIYGKEVI